MRKHRFWPRLLGTAACFIGGTSLLLADPSPQQQLSGSGTLQNNNQRIERYYQQQVPPKKPQEPLPQSQSTSTSTANLPKGAQFMLRKVEFTHSALLPQADLDAAVRPFLDREIDQAGLQRLLGDVNALYVKHKITTARAFIQSGDVSSGILHIKLVEGRLGKLTIEGTRHVHDGFIRRRIHVKDGEVVNTDDLRNDLVYLNRTTDLQAKALLEPGAQPGQTDILLDVAEPDRHSIDLFVDDNGVESTGRLRVGAVGHLYGLLGVDDRLEADVAHSSGANDGQISYSVPVTPDNGRLYASFARSQISVINGAFKNIDITGQSSMGSVGFSQPLIATMNWMLSGVGQYSIQDSNTHISGQNIADTRTRQITLGASLQHQREGETWGVTQLVTRIHSDEPMLGKDNFTIAPGNAYYIRRLWSSAWALRADLGWQLSTGKNIPSANLFQVGGLGSVRGYDRGVLSGPRGYYVGLELHRRFGENLDVFGFVDHGTIYSFYPTSKSITGFGPGLLYNYRKWLTVSADVAKPLQTVVPNQSGIRFDARVTLHWM